MQRCPCLSDWLRTLGDHGEAGNCSICGEDQAFPMFCGTLMASCLRSNTKVHAVGYMLHEKCIPLFEEAFAKKKRNLLYDRFPATTNTLATEPKLMEKLRVECRKKHAPTIVTCPTCHAHEQKGISFFRCAGCKMVSYCDQECQMADWPKHKEFCKARQNAPKEEQEEPAETPEEPCPCMNEIERAYLKRASTPLCSRPSCTKKVPPPFHFEAYFGQCTCPEISGVVMHTIPLKHCSVKCQKKVLH